MSAILSTLFDLNNSMTWAQAGSSWSAFYGTTDVSVRRESTPPGVAPEADRLFPNTLADLARREARFLHNPEGLTGAAAVNPSDPRAFPFEFAGGRHQATPAPDGLFFGPDSPRFGEDVILTNVLAFDVRVFDPGAGIGLIAGRSVVVPGDPGYAGTPVASGAYVDLGHGATGNPLLPAGAAPRFAGNGQPVAGTGASAATLPRTYDTWTLAYETNGRNEDNDWVDLNNNGSRDPGEDLVDEAFNGLDDNGDGVIDDPGERETSPPYPYPLRGVEVRIRCYEPSSRQVRQVTVRHTFVPH
jgi:hypothetical protein